MANTVTRFIFAPSVAVMNEVLDPVAPRTLVAPPVRTFSASAASAGELEISSRHFIH